jgi:hypothetical protein
MPALYFVAITLRCRGASELMLNQIPLAGRIAVLVLVGIFAVSVVTNRTSAQNPTAPAAAQTSTEKTVEQNHKNIQVLKGLPESQLIPVMNYMGASLGVRCNFCHVNNNGTWDYASDEKGEKKSAREMINMVGGINKTSFRGNAEVSCYTCHRGRSQVAHTVPVPLPTPEPRPSQQGPAPQQQQQPALPTAEQILDKYYQAVGGQAAIDKLKSRVMKGTLVLANGNELGYELTQSGTDMVLANMTTEKGVVQRAFNGTVGWEKNAAGIRDLSPVEIYFLRRYPSMFKDVNLKDQFTRISVAGKPKIDGRDVYVLRATTSTGQREQLYFDAETGLLVRRSTSVTTPVGVIPEQVDFSDYRDVDGMRLPFVVKVSTVDQNLNLTRKFTEVKLNVPVDPKQFNKPG